MTMCKCVIYPFGRPEYINFLKLILFMARDHLVGSNKGITHFFKATRNTTEGVGEEEQTNNMDLGQLQVQEG